MEEFSRDGEAEGRCITLHVSKMVVSKTPITTTNHPLGCEWEGLNDMMEAMNEETETTTAWALDSDDATSGDGQSGNRSPRQHLKWHRALWAASADLPHPSPGRPATRHFGRRHSL